MTDTTAPAALQPSMLPVINPAVAVPTFDRSAVRRSIVHIGVGGFHRAHLATYVNELCESGDTDWGIVGCGVMPGDSAMAEALGAQQNLYTLITRGTASTEVQVIGSILAYIHGSPDPGEIIDQIAHADTQIVSMTVTEGGYPTNDLTGEYDPESRNAGPGSTFGIIAAGLDRRRRAGGSPITIMSCDNIMSNGSVARAATLGEAARFGDELIEWIGTSVSFPNSMVDRITPATGPTDGAWLAETYAIDDRWPVVTEPFRQWVVEDNFAGERLPLEQLDVIITNDVEPYEIMKLRLLNASHSCLAYLAALDGIETVDRAMAEPRIAKFVQMFLDHEASPVVPPVQGIDIPAYNNTLIERFSNPAIGDQISRLCLDGSAKFPKFLLPTVRANVNRVDANQDGSLGLASLALAGWCQYLLGTTDHGQPIALATDPMLAEAVSYAEHSVDDPAAFLDFTAVFGEDLRDSAVFRAAFTDALMCLRTNGAASAIDTAISEVENHGGRPTN